MPKRKKQKNSILHFFHTRPLLGYICLTMGMMFILLLLEKNVHFFQANIIDVPRFDGSVLPIQKVPNWENTGGKNIREYQDYAEKEFIPLPLYDAKKLNQLCHKKGNTYRNSCVTYSVVYMGNYKMDHKENAGSHLAVDIRAPSGTPVYAVANGVVEKTVQKYTGFGKYIVIKHPNVPLVGGGRDTLFSSYAHLSKIVVLNGDIIHKGDIIGYTGNTGSSASPHLHFQVDTSSAPYHPWWPFSSAQSSAAGLSFFDGVNAGLGMAEALKNTVNPLVWTQEFLDVDMRLTEDTNTHSEDYEEKDNDGKNDHETPILGKLLIKISPSKVSVGESTTLLITALDQNKKIFTKYSGENIRITASDLNVTFPQPKFTDGKSEIPLEFDDPGNLRITVRDGDKVDTEKISIIQVSPGVEKELEEVHTALDVPETIEDEGSVQDIRIVSEDLFLMTKDTTTLTVTRFGKDGKIIKNSSRREDMNIVVDGPGEVQPKAIKNRYFQEGVARVDFRSLLPGKSEIFLEEFPDKKVIIEVIEEVKPIHSFRIYSDTVFQVGVPERVTVTTLDSQGNVTPKIFLGKASVRLLSGKARLSSLKLTEKDFKNGKGTIEVIPLSREPIVLQVKSGVLTGTSKKIEVEEETQQGDSIEAKEREIQRYVQKNSSKNIFEDISSENPYFDEISFLKEKNIISGDPNGLFHPSHIVNRAEFSKIIILALEIDPEEAEGTTFTDVPRDAWFASYVETAEKYGLIYGYPDGSFQPERTISRAELFTILERAKSAVSTSHVPFHDVPKDVWFTSAAIFASQNNLLEFSEYFFPRKPMTRAEVAKSVAQFLRI
jgi:murein DD-endopeptidase MepM/ murein hydrolase activator NlpD